MCEYTDAMTKLNTLGVKWGGEKFLDGETTLNFTKAVPNCWKMVDPEIADKGVLWSSFTTNTDKLIEGISYLEKNTTVFEHLHQSQEEELRVLSGELSYEIYEDSNGVRGKLLRKGVLHQWDKLNINRKEFHILFNANTDTYLYAKFIVVKDEQNL